MSERLKQIGLPIKTSDFKTKAEIFEAARSGVFPIINLKTGRTGKGEGCTCNCVYCDVGDKDGPYWQETKEENFKTLITNWANQGGKTIHWCGDGEPTTFKWFDTILDLAKKNNFKLEIFSNLTGLTPDRANNLMEIGATVKFKMDSRDPIILGEILTSTNNKDTAFKAGSNLIDKIDMLVQAREKSENKPQLVASIVMSEKNMHDIIKVLDWCCEFNVVPQVAYMEEIGSVTKTGIKALNEREIKIINRWLKIKFGLKDPKQIMGDQCEAKAAPILMGNRVSLGPFGMGCEFPLREHLGELNFIGEYKNDVGELTDTIKEFRFNKQNIQLIVEELVKIKEEKGIYSKTGTDEILPGCGDDIEELWFIEYVATIFTSDEYFKNFINDWVLKGEHRKWTKEEINSLINQVKTLM